MYLLPAEIVFWHTLIFFVVMLVLFVACLWWARRDEPQCWRLLFGFWVVHSYLYNNNLPENRILKLVDVYGEHLSLLGWIGLNGIFTGFILLLLAKKRHINAILGGVAGTILVILFICTVSLHLFDVHKHYKRNLEDLASQELVSLLTRIEGGEVVPLPKVSRQANGVKEAINERLLYRKVYCDLDESVKFEGFERLRYGPIDLDFRARVLPYLENMRQIVWTDLITSYDGCWFVISADFVRESDGSLVLRHIDLGSSYPTRDALLERRERGYDNVLLHPKRESAVFGPWK